ncbi:hypothetical protein A2T55_13835 [Brevibacterium linens]|uniref:CDP-Glycerol:Poly(Glycerophosphate) glycerophosphotransferase n=1 Tax=Brevibacterium linens TaxID=1703 RepID=A0A142NPJ3_BRELN|nr:CDP-glycerol glycerophosphotransferase family protein [Brevibacterium linens]AMT94695.1 hypothetical protein A2T55_13835 [Brevibacterium linens]
MKAQFRRAARAFLDSSAGSSLKSLVGDSGPARRKGIVLSGGTKKGDVIAYFADSPDKLYQLEQWLPAFEELNRHRPVVVVMRNASSFAAAQKLTDLPLVLAETQPDLIDLYSEVDYKLAIYVNNSMRNFQSMADPSIIHVHVDHGESDKTSSISNQLKAYDKVFVAGPAAEERCLQALWRFDPRKLQSIGRPPLDGAFQSVLPPDDRQTVLYAPTWQGENEANNFTSVDVFGRKIIRQLLRAGVRIVYRPHPRMVELGVSEVQQADEEIRALLAHSAKQGGGHLIATDQNLFDLFVDADILITDVSSVGLDFLYLHTDKGLLLTDRHDDEVRMRASSPIGAELARITIRTVKDLPRLLEEARTNESALTVRTRLKSYYFGEHLGEMSSTDKFIRVVDAAISERAEGRET